MKQQQQLSTNFFERQDKARRATNRLVIWFILALLGTTAAIYVVLFFVYSIYFDQSIESYWNTEIFLATIIGTFLVTGTATLIKSVELSGASGSKIAENLAGTKITSKNAGQPERRLLNVVQEMSIASGVPMPNVFVLYDEKSINAFAAGTKINNAAIAVSYGALTKLSRDELQGVIGHEFSHILNGDMKLNIKLIGWIFGLLIISQLGAILLRTGFVGNNSKNKKNSASILAIVGLGLYIIGAISQFFGRMIQSSISRQREHLADASSAQFTRNPIALANALSRIGGDSYGSAIQAPNASEYAHLFFAGGIKSLFATHPPLEERIRLLNPSWNGKFLPPLKAQNFTEESTESNNIPAASNENRNKSNAGVAQTMRKIPSSVESLAKTTDGARALMILLMMSDNVADDTEQARQLLRSEDSEFFSILKEHWEDVQSLPHELKIPTAQIAASRLKALPDQQKLSVWNTLRTLAETDGNISNFEQGLLSTFRDAINV